jgi:hypothetical protein
MVASSCPSSALASGPGRGTTAAPPVSVWIPRRGEALGAVNTDAILVLNERRSKEAARGIDIANIPLQKNRLLGSPTGGSIFSISVVQVSAYRSPTPSRKGLLRGVRVPGAADHSEVVACHRRYSWKSSGEAGGGRFRRCRLDQEYAGAPRLRVPSGPAKTAAWPHQRKSYTVSSC